MVPYNVLYRCVVIFGIKVGQGRAVLAPGKGRGLFGFLCNYRLSCLPFVSPCLYTVKNPVDFTVKYLVSGCQSFSRYFYRRLPVEHF